MQIGKPGSSHDVEEFPRIVDEIGENPARWLDRDLITPGAVRQDIERAADRSIQDVRLIPDQNVSSGITFVESRIRGIDTIEAVRAWKAVERALGRGPDGGPRDAVIELLDEREAELEEIGERPDRLEHGPRLPPAWTTVESSATWTDTEDGSRPTAASVGGVSE